MDFKSLVVLSVLGIAMQSAQAAEAERAANKSDIINKANVFDKEILPTPVEKPDKIEKPERPSKQEISNPLKQAVKDFQLQRDEYIARKKELTSQLRVASEDKKKEIHDQLKKIQEDLKEAQREIKKENSVIKDTLQSEKLAAKENVKGQVEKPTGKDR